MTRLLKEAIERVSDLPEQEQDFIATLVLAEIESERQWMAGLAKEWADELGDARQDIYTLNDGEPVNAGG